MPSLAKLAAQLGVTFRDQRLLRAAVTHGSYANEHPVECAALPTAERLEFLGDAVLNFETANLLFERFPDRSEGELSELRSALVKASTLAGFARHFNLGAYIRMSRGEESSGARQRDALLADTFEALIAAIYLDAGEQGLAAVRAVFFPLLEGQIEQIAQRESRLDYRSRLQEYVQATRNITPRYEIISAEGPDHQRTFTTRVFAGEQQLGSGVGNSKQSSAQEAAREALEALRMSG